MAFFNEFPHARTYDSDLGWLIWAMKKLIGDMEEFTEVNSIKFADPITWNIASQYEPTTIVIDNDGNGYISRQAVPAGIALTDTAYWTRIFNFSEITNNLTNGIAYNNGSEATAGKAFLKDELIWFNNRIYRVLYDIAAGTALIPDTNIEATTFADYILEVRQEIDTVDSDLTSQMATLTQAVNAAVETVRETDTQLRADVQDSITTLETTVNGQITDLETTVNGQITTLQNDVDTQLSEFEADVNSDIAAAEVRLSQQITEEISRQITNVNDGIGGALFNKRIAVLGDSLTIGSGSALGHTWVEQLAERYGAITYNYGASGSKISSGGSSGASADDMVTRIDAILNQHPALDYFILMGGANDKNDSVQIASVNATGTNTFIGAIKNIINKVRLKYGGSCKILLMTTYHRYDTFNNIGKCESDYVDAMITAGNFWSIPVFDNYNNAGIALNHPSAYPTADEWADIHYADGSGNLGHFSRAAYDYLTPIYANFIVNSYCTNKGQFLNYQTVDGTVFTKFYMPNGLTVVTARNSFTNKQLNGGSFGGDNYTNDITFNIPERFKVNTPTVIGSVYGVAGIGAFVIRNVSQDSGSNISSITYRVTRRGASADATASGFFCAMIVGFSAN